jgi:selenocysteine lyase/cysteine desulfurase
MTVADLLTEPAPGADAGPRNPNLELLGSLEVPRLPIVSFRVRHGGRLLHHELVVALLNDLFGIQARGGCSCAGPYGHRLLGIGPERSRALSEQAGHGYLGIKPGWVRSASTTSSATGSPTT